MKIQYKLSIFFALLILILGVSLIVLNSRILALGLQQSLLSREKIGLELLEKRLSSYMMNEDYLSITSILFEEKEIKHELVEYILVYNADGILVSHTFLTDIPESFIHDKFDVSDPQYIERHLINEQSIVEIGQNIQSESYVFGRLYVGYKELYITNIISQSNKALAFMILIAGIFVLFIGYLFSRILVKPIKDMTEGMELVSKGHLDIQLKSNTNDELAIMSNVFNQMVNDLNKSRRTVDDYSRTLERKVEERTVELKEREDRLERQNKELVRLDQEKDEFVSLVSHELKTPLTSIKGFTQIMKNEEVSKDEKKRKYYCEMIDKNTVRLYNLILDIVDSSRLSLGKLKMELKETDIPLLFQEIKENMEMIIKEKGIRPDFKIEENLPKINADQSRLLQVLKNLIINAVHFTEKGTISLKVYKKDNFVQFEIKDTGEGIPKDKQGLIFSKFFQADASNTRRIKGSGLGLSISKGLVEAMGGKMWFESEEGKGTTFYFTIPTSKESEK